MSRQRRTRHRPDLSTAATGDILPSPWRRYRRWFLYLVVLLLVATLVWGIETWQRPPRGANFVTYCKIQVGMTEQDVQQVVGSPVQVPGGGVVSLLGHENTQLKLAFDKRGQLTHKSFRPPSTLVGRIEAYLIDHFGL